MGQWPEPPLHFNLVVQKADDTSLGIDLYSSAAWQTRNVAVISKIRADGIVAAWNTRSKEPKRVRPGDFIFQVNDIHSDTVSIIMELKVKQTVTIHVLRSQHLAGEEEIQCLQGRVPERRPDIADIESMMSSCGYPRGPDAQTEEDVIGVPRTALCAGSFARPPPGSAARPRSLRMEALAPRLAALGDDALAALFCAVLEQRPAAREALLGRQ